MRNYVSAFGMGILAIGVLATAPAISAPTHTIVVEKKRLDSPSYVEMKHSEIVLAARDVCREIRRRNVAPPAVSFRRCIRTKVDDAINQSSTPHLRAHHEALARNARYR